jgi:Polyketide cyclase / dehydrase and lipid transport
MAMRLEFTIEIHRSPREVFALVGNLENDPKWQSAIITATKLTAGPVGEGTRFRHVMNLMGRRTDVDLEIVGHEPERRYALHGACGPLLFGTEVRFERIAQGTRLVTLIEVHAKGVLRFAAMALSNHRKSEIEADLHRLKLLMESDAI